VTELDPVRDFYRDVVGLEVRRTGAGTAALGVEDTTLLVLEEAVDGTRRTRNAAGLYHNAFRVPTQGALGDALARLREHGSLGGASDHGVSEALYSTDPEGNGVEIYRDHPPETWPTTDDGRVRMTTEPLDHDAVAASATGGARLPSGSDLGHVHLEVTSLAAFRECYVETIGFTMRATVPGAAFVAAGDYHHHVGANTWHQRRDPASGPGLEWFEIALPAADARGLRERLAASRFEIDETDAGFAITDPDGIRIRFRTA
jgi:catechol 2,3-dioxygenase